MNREKSIIMQHSTVLVSTNLGLVRNEEIEQHFTADYLIIFIKYMIL